MDLTHNGQFDVAASLEHKDKLPPEARQLTEVKGQPGVALAYYRQLDEGIKHYNGNSNVFSKFTLTAKLKEGIGVGEDDSDDKFYEVYDLGRAKVIVKSKKGIGDGSKFAIFNKYDKFYEFSEDESYASETYEPRVLFKSEENVVDDPGINKDSHEKAVLTLGELLQLRYTFANNMVVWDVALQSLGVLQHDIALIQRNIAAIAKLKKSSNNTPLHSVWSQSSLD